MLRPRRYAHARLRGWVVQQPQGPIRLPRRPIPLAALSLRVRKDDTMGVGLYTSIRHVSILRPRVESSPAGAATECHWDHTLGRRMPISHSKLRMVRHMLRLHRHYTGGDAAAVPTQNEDTAAVRHVLPPPAALQRLHLPARRAARFFPASDIIGYKRRTHGAPHYTVSEGVRGVQHRLIRGINITQNARVTAVEQDANGVRMSWAQDDGLREEVYTDYFDKVILAVAPDVVGRIFKPLERHMHRIPTTIVESVVHTDYAVLNGSDVKKTRRQGAQLIRLNTSTRGTHTTEAHHLQPCGVVVTTCPFSSLTPQSVKHSAKFTRVLRSPESQRIVNAIFREDARPCADEKAVPFGGMATMMFG
jgi:hypothetical protein